MRIFKRFFSMWAKERHAPRKKTEPQPPVGVAVNPLPSSPSSFISSPFLLDKGNLKNIFNTLNRYQVPLVRKYVFALETKKLAIDGDIKSEHKELVEMVFKADSSQKEKFTGGIIKFQVKSSGLYEVSLFNYSVYYDSQRPDFFDYLKDMRIVIRKEVEKIIREVFPQAKFQDFQRTMKEEIFLVDLSENDFSFSKSPSR